MYLTQSHCQFANDLLLRPMPVPDRAARTRARQVGWFMIAGLVALANSPQGAVAQCEREWAKEFELPGLNGSVLAAAVFNDGGGDALYVGGYFSGAGNSIASLVARWDGGSWSALGSGLEADIPLPTSYHGDAPYVAALAVFDDGNGPALYAGGQFTIAGGASANNIAKWDGFSWSALTTGMNGPVYSLAVFDDGNGPALYAGGAFTIAGGTGVDSIAKWNPGAPGSWSPVGILGNTEAYLKSITALTVLDNGSDPLLYAGGFFRNNGKHYHHGPLLRKWNGIAWSGLGVGEVYSGEFYDEIDFIAALAVFDDGSGPALFVGGSFEAGGGVASNIAKWNGTTWSALGSEIYEVRAFAVFDDGSGPALYAGHNLSGTRKWDGKSWSDVGDGSIFMLTVFDDGNGPTLYAGGQNVEGGRGIAKWDSENWSSLGIGLNNWVSSLALFDDGQGPALYAAGTFTYADGIPANYIAKRSGSSWSPLGSGLNGSATSLIVFDDGNGPALYVGGYFTTAGGVGASRIAKWNGSSWSPLGTGTSGLVRALAVFDDGDGPALYAGGDFSTAGGVVVKSVAKWDGTNWSALGSGTVSGVEALAAFDDGRGPALYAGGPFFIAGGVAANRIAKWDGSNWSRLGTGVGSEQWVRVKALAVFDDGEGSALYAGGNFPTAGGISANGIAKWNGASWSALGTGMNSYVLALTVFDDGAGPALYAGGYFTVAGGVETNRVAKWNGSSWSPLESGMTVGVSASVNSLVAFDDGTGEALYAGGSFTTAGGNVSASVAKWSCAHWGDMNQDTVVDLSDVAQFLSCFEGPNQSVTDSTCLPGDIDSDLNIDLADFARVQRTFSW